MIKDIDTLVRHAEIAFESYQHVSGHDKKLFLYAIAQKLEDLGDKLIETCMSETHLPYNRFVGERARTCMQLRMFGDLVGEGSWVDAVIEIGDPLRKPIPKPDMRKMLTPIGPVVVFGASNFPLAYATPGGDTASALAAGCTVIVRGHPQHPKTSEMCAQAIIEAAKETHMPKYVFQHINLPEHEVGKRLVMHSGIKSVGFTGSLQGGRALLQYAHQRQEPIPVFAEMGSINPVLLLRNKLREDTPFIAQQLAQSITMGVGQFCTKPGIILGVKSTSLNHFTSVLSLELSRVKNYKMLHSGIHDNYCQNMKKTLSENGIELIYQSNTEDAMTAQITLARVEGKDFKENRQLHEEIFGPFAIIVACQSYEELIDIWKQMPGQLSTSIWAQEEDLEVFGKYLHHAKNIAGRIVINNIPTGVEVSSATVHGGPYPSTTDVRFTSVGEDAIKRWVKPVCFQDYPSAYLPPELQDQNPLGIVRKANRIYTKAPL